MYYHEMDRIFLAKGEGTSIDNCLHQKAKTFGINRIFSRVADPVHFRPAPDPDPANQNFKTGSRILLALT